MLHALPGSTRSRTVRICRRIPPGLRNQGHPRAPLRRGRPPPGRSPHARRPPPGPRRHRGPEGPDAGVGSVRAARRTVASAAETAAPHGARHHGARAAHGERPVHREPEEVVGVGPGRPGTRGRGSPAARPVLTRGRGGGHHGRPGEGGVGEESGDVIVDEPEPVVVHQIDLGERHHGPVHAQELGDGGCSRVWGMTPSSAATTSSRTSMPVAPASMFRMKSSCPGTSTTPEARHRPAPGG